MRYSITKQDQLDTIKMDHWNDDREGDYCHTCDFPATHSYQRISESPYNRRLETVHICDWCLARDPQARAEIAEQNEEEVADDVAIGKSVLDEVKYERFFKFRV